MAATQLLIKYQGKYICSKTKHKIDFIEVPQYYLPDSYSNLSIFITLFYHKVLDENYYSTIALNEREWSDLFESGFAEEYLEEIEPNTYLYDLDELINDSCSDEERKEIYKRLKTLPSNLIFFDENAFNNEEKFTDPGEYEPFFFQRLTPIVTPNLINCIKTLRTKRTDKDVLLMYSGGKDSTLAAIRLVNMGYNVYFIHFDNGATLDTDKPYLTWKNIFCSLEVYQFPFKYAKVNIKNKYQEFFQNWEENYGNVLKDGSIDSEIRCLACRSAMYNYALKIAIDEGFKYIAEGARISQEFFIEQPIMLSEYQNIAQKFGIELLFPVLEVENDQEVIQELLDNSFSSKTWESKCILGRKAKAKTKKDKKLILKYFQQNISPEIIRYNEAYLELSRKR